MRVKPPGLPRYFLHPSHALFLPHLFRLSSEQPNRLEFAAEHLHQAMRDLGRITGRVDIEDILDVLFKDFCIGK